MMVDRSRHSATHTIRRLLRRPTRWVAPLALAAALIVTWEASVRFWQVPSFKLAAPSTVASVIHDQANQLAEAWVVTAQTMAAAIVAAIVVGVAIAALFASFRAVEAALFPYMVVLQVTPLVAVAPFLILWINDVWLAQVACAWIVAFFPILSNTAVGLRSADAGLKNLFDAYHATRWQKLRLLLLPSALPFFFAGLRVSANLALVGAVVAEFVIGPEAERRGLATIILESLYRQDTPLMLAALIVVSATGVAVYFAVHLCSGLFLGLWHESELHIEK